MTDFLGLGDRKESSVINRHGECKNAEGAYKIMQKCRRGNKRGTENWNASMECVQKRVTRKHITGSSGGTASSGETYIDCKDWS